MRERPKSRSVPAEEPEDARRCPKPKLGRAALRKEAQLALAVRNSTLPGAGRGRAQLPAPCNSIAADPRIDVVTAGTTATT